LQSQNLQSQDLEARELQSKKAQARELQFRKAQSGKAPAEGEQALDSRPEHFQSMRGERSRASQTVKPAEPSGEKERSSDSRARSFNLEPMTARKSRRNDSTQQTDGIPSARKGKDTPSGAGEPADRTAASSLKGSGSEGLINMKAPSGALKADIGVDKAAPQNSEMQKAGSGNSPLPPKDIGGYQSSPRVSPPLQSAAPSTQPLPSSEQFLDRLKESAAIDSLFVLRQYTDKADDKNTAAAVDDIRTGKPVPVPGESRKVTAARGREAVNPRQDFNLQKDFLLSTSQDIFPKLFMKQGPETRPVQGEKFRIRLDGSSMEFFNTLKPDQQSGVASSSTASSINRAPIREESQIRSIEEKSGVLSSTPKNRAESRPPIQEKSFVERRKEIKGQDSEPISMIGQRHTEPISSVRELERMYSMTGGSFFTAPGILDTNRQFIRMTEKFDMKKAVENEGMTIVGDIRGGDERYGEGEYYDDSMREERHEGSLQGSLPRAPKKQAEHLQQKAAEQSQRDTVEIRKAEVKNEAVQSAAREVVQSKATEKQAEVKKVDQASQHATTSIESVIKKSQHETWTGDEMAAKLIWLLMKAASTFTFEHSSRVIGLSTDLAREIGITDESQLRTVEEGAMFHDIGETELDLKDASPQVQARLSKYLGTMDLKNCSFLHDIGKVKIPDSILYKPGRLTDEEFEILKQHPVIGEQILKPIPSMQHVLPVVRHHHEKWDGKGYPDGLKGEESPLPARIVSITDAYDAMVSDRPYRKGMPVEDALKELKRCAGTHFDPNLVEAFVKVIERNQKNGGEF
jgi:HD-GYP domain-containing protein (c-di-GMP phosphodiesterase class II)